VEAKKNPVILMSTDDEGHAEQLKDFDVFSEGMSSDNAAFFSD